MGAILEIKYFNAFWTKKLKTGIPYVGDSSSGTNPGPVQFGDAVQGLGNQGLNGTTGTAFYQNRNRSPVQFHQNHGDNQYCILYRYESSRDHHL